MIKQYSKLIFAGITALFAISARAVCPEMEIWSDGIHYRYLIKDVHVDYIDGRVSIKQQSDIIWAAEQKKAADVFVLAEDAYTYPGTNKKIQHLYRKYMPETLEQGITLIQESEKIDRQKARGSMQIFEMSPLICLANECQKHGIRNYNIECSHVRNMYDSKLSFTEKVTQQEVIDDLEKIAAEIRKDKHLWEKFGFKEDIEFIQNMRKLKQLATPNDNKQFMDTSSELRSDLVDVRAIVMLIKWQQYKHGFICAGALHIEVIKEGLEKLGYKKIKTFGNAQAITFLIEPDALGMLSKEAQEESTIEMGKQVLQNALDLKHTFQVIFAAQLPQPAAAQAPQLKAKIELAPTQDIITLQNQASRLNKLILEADANLAQLLFQGKENTTQYRELCATSELYNQQIRALQSQIDKLQAQAKIEERAKKAAQDQLGQTRNPKPAVNAPSVDSAYDQKPATPKVQKPTLSSSIIGYLYDYKWPIIICSAAITAFAAWPYWGK